MSTTIAKRGNGSELKNFLMGQSVQSALLRAVPAHLRNKAGIEKITSAAITCASLNPSLLKCDKTSFLRSMIVAAQLGLELGGPLAEAHAIPFKDQCNLIIGYQGLMRLARQSGEIASIEARVVHDGDEFEIRLGTETSIRHIPAVPRMQNAQVRGVYAVAHLKDEGSRPLIEWMEKSEVDAIKAGSRSGGRGPWVDHYEEMARKTALRRLLKYAPRSTELAQAMTIDAGSDSGEDTAADIIDLDLSEPEAETQADAIEQELQKEIEG